MLLSRDTGKIRHMVFCIVKFKVDWKNDTTFVVANFAPTYLKKCSIKCKLFILDLHLIYLRLKTNVKS